MGMQSFQSVGTPVRLIRLIRLIHPLIIQFIHDSQQ